MKHTLAQLEAAIDAGKFKANEDWQILTSGAVAGKDRRRRRAVSFMI